MMSDLHEDVFIQNYARTNRLRHTSRSASADLSAAKRRAKEAGVDLQIMDMARRFAELTPTEFAAKINKFFDYITWLQLHGAASLLRIQAPDLTKDPGDADHFAEGRLAALEGFGMDKCPWDVTQGAGQHWIEGWHDGNRAASERVAVEENVELIKSGIKPLEEDANAPPEDTPAFLTKAKAKPVADTGAPGDTADLEGAAQPDKPKVGRSAKASAKAKPVSKAKKAAPSPRKRAVSPAVPVASDEPGDEPAPDDHGERPGMADVADVAPVDEPPAPPEEAVAEPAKERPKKVDIDAILARHAKPRQQDAA